MCSSQKEIHPLTDSQQKLETGNAKDEHEQTTKPFNNLATKTSWAATWNPGTQKAFTPSTPMEFQYRSMLVTEVFFFKASASAWPKGKRLGSRSKLTSVRRHEIQTRHNSQFPTLSFQRTIPTGFRANVFDTEMHFQPILYHANIPVESIPHHTTSDHTEWVQVKKKFTHFTDRQEKLETGNAKNEHEQTTKPFKSWRQRHHEQPLGIPRDKRPSLPHRRWNWQAGRCLSRKCSSSKLRLVPGQRESDMEVDQIWHLRDLMKYKSDTTLSFRLWVSKEQFPLDSGQMSFTEVHSPPHIMPISQ